jgi:hypothetical protein
MLLGVGWAAADAKPLTIKEIMGKLNKGPYALTPNIKQGLQQAEPNWTTIQEQTKQYIRLAADLTKNAPPQGEKASWDKLAEQYTAAAQTLDAAAQKKDKAAALAAHVKLTGSCNACHQAHKK